MWCFRLQTSPEPLGWYRILLWSASAVDGLQSSICKEIEVLRSSIVIMLSSYDVEGLIHLLMSENKYCGAPTNQRGCEWAGSFLLASSWYIGRYDLQVSAARHFWREKSVYLLVWQRLIDGKMRLEYNYGATIQWLVITYHLCLNATSLRAPLFDISAQLSYLLYLVKYLLAIFLPSGKNWWILYLQKIGGCAP